MTTQTLVVVLVVVVIAVVTVAAWWYAQQRRRSEHLRDQFGPEYDRALREHGGRGPAEAALQEREERVQQLHIRPLAPADRARFADSWRSVQARFVDDPEGAIGEADRLVQEVMQARGYPMGNFEQRAADVSVDHPQEVEHYRAAHAIAQHQARGEATTEDLRQAMVHYRALFEDLLEAEAQNVEEVRRG